VFIAYLANIFKIPIGLSAGGCSGWSHIGAIPPWMQNTIVV